MAVKKLDPALSYAVNKNQQKDKTYSVFIEVKKNTFDKKVLEDIGISIPNNYTNIFTGDLSTDQINKLVSYPWVTSISKSKTMNLKSNKKLY